MTDEIRMSADDIDLLLAAITQAVVKSALADYQAVAVVTAWCCVNSDRMTDEQTERLCWMAGAIADQITEARAN